MKNECFCEAGETQQMNKLNEAKKKKNSIDLVKRAQTSYEFRFAKKVELIMLYVFRSLNINEFW